MAHRLTLLPAALLLHLLPALAGAEEAPPTRIDLTLLGGVTATDGRTDGGVRFAEAAVEPAPRLRLWLQYDGSLGLDNATLSRSGVAAPAAYLGGLLGYGSGHATRLEVGGRNVDGERQLLLRGEQVVALSPGLFGKAGAWAAIPAEGRAEGVANVGVSFPATRSLRLEPTIFVARSAVPGEHDARLLLSADLAVGRSSLGAGLGAGRTWGRANLPDGTVVTAVARASFPLRGPARGQLLATHERPAAGPTVSVVAAGVSLTTGSTR